MHYVGGDQRALQRYDDLIPLDRFVRQSLQDASAQLRPAPQPVPVKTTLASAPMTDATLLSMLEDMGIASDIAAILLAEVRASMPDAGALDLVGAIADKLRDRGPEAVPRKPKRKQKTKTPETVVEGDLRNIDTSGDAYAAFADAGYIRSPFTDAA